MRTPPGPPPPGSPDDLSILTTPPIELQRAREPAFFSVISALSSGETCLGIRALDIQSPVSGALAQLGVVQIIPGADKADSFSGGGFPNRPASDSLCDRPHRREHTMSRPIEITRFEHSATELSE